jgi:hypothetical protein
MLRWFLCGTLVVMMRQTPTRSPGLLRAIAVCGSIKELARRLGIRPGGIASDWHKIPMGRIAQVSAATGIPADELQQ